MKLLNVLVVSLYAAIAGSSDYASAAECIKEDFEVFNAHPLAQAMTQACPGLGSPFVLNPMAMDIMCTPNCLSALANTTTVFPDCEIEGANVRDRLTADGFRSACNEYGPLAATIVTDTPVPTASSTSTPRLAPAAIAAMATALTGVSILLS